MKVSHVSGDVKSGDLPLALGVLVEAADEASDNQARAIDSLTKGNEVAIGLDMLNSALKVQDDLLLVRIESGAAREPAKKALEVGSV